MNKSRGTSFFNKAFFVRDKLNNFGSRISEKKLIVVDYRVLIIFMLSIIFFSIMVLFKIQGSSVPFWNNVVSDGNDKNEGLVIGHARAIRGDEWMVQTPFTLSQVNSRNKFSTENKSLGDGKVPLLMSLPSKDISAFFRPQNWGFFFLDSERGFSFFWGYKIFALFLSFFLLLMIVTKSNFWISFLGSVWLFFSSFIQWWFSIGLPEMVTAFSFIFIGVSYIFVSKKKPSIVIAALLLSIFSVEFVLFLYPPFQVPLAYLLIFLIIGFLFENLSYQNFKNNLRIRLGSIIFPIMVFISSLTIFYLGAKETLSLIMNTAYPGKRAAVNVPMQWSEFFSGFYGILMNESKYPVVLGNICEASSFVLLFPLVVFSVLQSFIKRKKSNLILISMVAFLILLSLWMLVGFPDPISKATLMNFVTYKKRASIALGIASIVSLAIALSRAKAVVESKKVLFPLLGLIFLALLAHGVAFKEIAPNILGDNNTIIIIISLYFTFLSCLFLRGKGYAFFFFASVIVFAANFYVNPISKGLGPIYNKELSKFVKTEDERSPNASWVFFGPYGLADFMKASGANVLNGTQYTPKLESYKILDPEGKNDLIYNRYAHISFTDNSEQNASFSLLQADLIDIKIDPCSRKLAELGVDHFVFYYRPDEKTLSCLKPLSDHALSQSMWAYERK